MGYFTKNHWQGNKGLQRPEMLPRMKVRLQRITGLKRPEMLPRTIGRVIKDHGTARACDVAKDNK